MIKMAGLVNQISLDSLFTLSVVSLDISMTEVTFPIPNITLVNLTRLCWTKFLLLQALVTLPNPQSRNSQQNQVSFPNSLSLDINSLAQISPNHILMPSSDQPIVPYDLHHLHQFLPNVFTNVFLLTSTFLTLAHKKKKHVEKKIPKRILLGILPKQPTLEKTK